jgi:hypothetical protein
MQIRRELWQHLIEVGNQSERRAVLGRHYRELSRWIDPQAIVVDRPQRPSQAPPPNCCFGDPDSCRDLISRVSGIDKHGDASNHLDRISSEHFGIGYEACVVKQ